MSFAAPPWRPLLDGDLAAQATDTIDAIVRAVSPLRFTDVTLARGACGSALLFHYLDAAHPSGGHRAMAERHLDDAIEGLTAAELPAGLYHGFTGVAWTAQHLRRDGDDDLNDDIDPIIFECLSRPWSLYDLIGGVVGLGVYATERAALPCLARAVDRLREMAVPRGAGLTWFTSPEDLGPKVRSRAPDGWYNLGVAHGVPGVIALVAAAVARGLPALDLLDAAVAWLLSKEISTGAEVTFPYCEVVGDVPDPARIAWCYGDPGIAVTLLGAARSVGNRAWEEKALAIARRAAQRSLETSGVLDAGLCHGAAGVAHLFNRMFQLTGDDLLGEAARTWFARTLAMRRPGIGLAGYRTFEPERTGAQWVDDPSVFTGVAGIALALLAAVSPVDPVWDRLLLASLPAAEDR
jgi:hypothetical protein